MNKEIIKNQAETIARVFEKQTSHKMAHSTALEIVSALYGKKNYNVLADFINPETVLAELNESELSHAQNSNSDDYGNECVITSINGRKLKVAAYPNECDYVRITDRADNEVAYWVSDEWADSPAEVMGAIVGALNGGEKIELPSFATKKAPSLKILSKPLSPVEILKILQSDASCEAIISVSLDDISAGIEAMNDIAEEAITNHQSVELDGEEVNVSISDISYTPVGAKDGAVLIQVNCQIDTY